MNITYRSAIEYPIDTLVDLLNRGFEGYIVDVQFSRPSFLSVLTRDDVDLTLSQVAEIDGAPAAIGLIARRGWTARLAAMGVAPEKRGQGIGKGLVAHTTAQLKDQGVRSLTLEVIEQNKPAVALYEQAHFIKGRRLVSFNYGDSNLDHHINPSPHSHKPQPLQEVDIATVASHLTADHLSDLPWQLSGTSLMVDGPPNRAYQLDQSFIIITDPAQPRISIRSIFVAPDHRGQGKGTEIVGAILAEFPDKTWGIPALCPQEIGSIFLRNGFHLGEISQLQMKRTL